MKQMHYYIVTAIVVNALVFSLQDGTAGSAEYASKTEYTKPKRNDAKLNNVRLNEYVNFKDSTERQKQTAKFYENRNFGLAWFENGKLNRNGRELLGMLKNAGNEGLSSDYYNLQEIESEIDNLKLAENVASYQLASLDLMLTDAYIDYASDISTGKVNPEDLDVAWETNPEQTDYCRYLEQALENNQIKESLVELRPKNKQYKLLIDAYKRLSDTKENGAWLLPGNDISTLEENDSVPEVVLVKKCLSSTGYLMEKDTSYINSAKYDERLIHAVKNFQRDHGLEADGILGKNTLAEMNRPIEYRLAQIRLNIDRLRWLPNLIGSRDVIVNIPDFKLRYFENNKLVHEMGVVVGKTTTTTPALKDTISYIVINPTWNVPWSIATDEMLPKIKADSSYLARNNYNLVRGSYASDDVVNPQSVDWLAITADNFPFSVIQRPGYSNALGRVKFMLPNNHAIYLHDTPANHLFNRNQRDFSHGCVRLERPFQLAETLLAGQMTPQEIRQILDSRKTRSIVLDKPVAVHLIYHTAWVDDFGNLQFRRDLYGFDERSMLILNKTSQPLANKKTNAL